MIVDHDADDVFVLFALGGHEVQDVRDLSALVGHGSGRHTDLRTCLRDLIANILGEDLLSALGNSLTGGDDGQKRGLLAQARFDASEEILILRLDGWNNDMDVIAGVLGIRRDRSGFVQEEVGEEVNYEAVVTNECDDEQELNVSELSTEELHIEIIC